MSRKQIDNPAATTEEAASAAAEVAQETEKAAAKTEEAAGVFRAAKQGPLVYCGPTVRGVAKQYTVYSGDIPEGLKAFIGKHPAAKALVVPVERFAQIRRKVETAGTAEAILYHKIKSEL